MFPTIKIERWYWLGVFCLISLSIHIGLALRSPKIYSMPRIEKTPEIEVALEAPPAEVIKPAAEIKPIPQPPPKVAPKLGITEKELAKLLNPRRDKVPPALVDPKAKEAPLKVVKVVKPPEEKRPTAPNAEVGGFDRLREEKPIVSGLPTGIKDAGEPKIQKVAKLDLTPGGGGSPSPGPIPGGHGGFKGPEAPPEDILFNGGGAGGMKLPRAAPRIGGGGGASILSVENPLAKEAIPEDKPGLGPGKAGGQGAGAGNGVGYGNGLGIGTRLDGKEALATLHAKPGVGIGAGEGKNIGTRPPGGGKGTGAELPGTGGTGIGYGRGSGIGIGNGSGTGVGDGSGARPGRMRGVPFGDVAGLLRGDSNGGGGRGGGPGGPGRGAVFGTAPRGSAGGGPVHICYVLDVSGSMLDGNKLGKAKAALTKALNELKPVDSFNIIVFWGRTSAFSDVMTAATPGNIEAATDYVDGLRTGNATNLSLALDRAFQQEGLTHIFLLTDGEPTVGLKDPEQIRQHVKEINGDRHIHLICFGLTLGENFEAMDLLKGIASDNAGQYSSVDLSRDRPERQP